MSIDNDDKHVKGVYEIAYLVNGELSWLHRLPSGEKLPIKLEHLEVISIQLVAYVSRELQALRNITLNSQLAQQRRIIGPEVKMPPDIAR